MQTNMESLLKMFLQCYPTDLQEENKKKETKLQLIKPRGNLEQQNFASQVQFLPADHS